MRKILWLVLGLWLGGRWLSAGAESYGLTDGTSVTGDVVRYEDNGVLIRTPDDVYTNLTWTRFSQDGLKVLAQNPKIMPFVEPFIIPPPVARAPKEEIKIQPVSRLEPPPKASLMGAMFSSPVGLIVMLVIYAANLFAALEISIFRSRPVGLMLGVAAVLPILGPIIFVSLPGQAEPKAAPEEEVEAAPGAAPPASAPTASASAPEAAGTSGEAAAPPSGIHLASSSWQSAERGAPAAQVFQRGQFMFNRRFFETKFTGFFGLIRREADKHLVLLVKTPHGQFDVQRITRIAANDVHFEVLEGAARKEVMVPFAEIQEVQLKPKDA